FEFVLTDSAGVSFSAGFSSSAPVFASGSTGIGGAGGSVPSSPFARLKASAPTPTPNARSARATARVVHRFERTNRPKSRAPRTTKKGKRTQERRATVDPPPPAQPAQAFGHLTVFAEPFARVRVNGKEIGITPIPKHRVQVGEYTVEFIDPVSGAVRTSRRVEVAENSRVRVTDR
ncbi:MAG: hypothetical protein AAFQ82_25235, partial [Myxococcota bacterium]